MTDGFNSYKNAIKAKYEQEKSGGFSNYLSAPTDAKLRRLCTMRLQDNPSENDHAIFAHFFGYRFEGNGQKLARQAERFRTINLFLKGKSVLTDENAADLLALLVDFEPRPLRRFLKANASLRASLADAKRRFKGNDDTSGGTPEIPGIPDVSRRTKKTWGWIAATMVAVAFVGVAVSWATTTECLTWHRDRYQRGDCDAANPGVPFDEKLLHFEKITPSDTTTFFKNGRPVVWYSKQNNTYEFFNADGKHPVTGRDLRPVTTYLVHRRVWLRAASE